MTLYVIDETELKAYTKNLVVWLGKAHIPKDNNWKRNQNVHVNMKIKNMKPYSAFNKGNLYTLT